MECHITPVPIAETYDDNKGLIAETYDGNKELNVVNAVGKDHPSVLLRDDILEKEWKNLTDLERERDQYKRAFMLECAEKHQATIENEKALIDLENSAKRHSEHLQGQIKILTQISETRADLINEERD